MLTCLCAYRQECLGETALPQGFVLYLVFTVHNFEGLEKMAPSSDLAPLKFLTAHETAAIEFAKLEHAGVADSAEPLRRYLAAHPPTPLRASHEV